MSLRKANLFQRRLFCKRGDGLANRFRIRHRQSMLHAVMQIADPASDQSDLSQLAHILDSVPNGTQTRQTKIASTMKTFSRGDIEIRYNCLRDWRASRRLAPRVPRQLSCVEVSGLYLAKYETPSKAMSEIAAVVIGFGVESRLCHAMPQPDSRICRCRYQS